MTRRTSALEPGETLATDSPVGDGGRLGSAASPGVLRIGGTRYGEPALLGRGGMGEVHLRRDQWLGRQVAVKTLGAERSSLAVARTRFLREARVQGQLEHPAIVPVYDIGIDEQGHEYFTMKRVTGRTLKEVLGEGDFPRNRLLGLLRQVCLAVDYAHSRGVVHRDLKPANVMIGDFGEVYVLDWGLAKVAGVESGVEPLPPGDGGETLSGHLLGTPGYMAPEQIDSAALADDRADVYSLGAVLFEILAEEPLHQGGSVDELLRSTREARQGRPSERSPDLDVPPELDALCVRATARHPDDRTIAAREIALAIERFVEGDRDLAARRALAVKHAEAASIAAGAALSGGREALAARARALNEAGRALTLDPENVAGASTLLELIARPPAELPDEVRAEIARGDLEAMRMRNRKGSGMFVVFLLGILSVQLCGVQSWPLFASILVPLVGALVTTFGILASPGLTLERFEARQDWVVGLGLVAVAFQSVLMTSSVVVPVLALAIAMGGAVAARPGRRKRYIVMGVCAFVVPFLVEWSHLLSWALPGLQFSAAGALIPAGAIALPDLPTRLLLLLGTCGSMLAPGITVLPVLDAAAALRRQSLLQVWHLRQLAATEPLGGASAVVAA